MADALTTGSALGMLETHGLVAAIEAADAMLKASAVRLVRQQRTVPAMVTHFVAGDTAAVRSAVDAGAAAAARVGTVFASHVIPSPSRDVWRVLVGTEPEPAPPRPAPPAEGDGRPAGDGPERAEEGGPSDQGGPAGRQPAESPPPGDGEPEGYASMTVRELRSLARDRDDERLQGRAISAASKGELVAFLEESDAGQGG